jgi:uncharacterized protein YbjT (DUF2867 family)
MANTGMTGGDGRMLFLTGATGHTGSRVARRMLDEGWRLRCLVHTPERAKFLPTDERLEVIEGDVARPEEWGGRLKGAAALIHMAHVGFAAHIVRACEAAGVKRVIALSSTRRFTRFPEVSARRVIDGEAALDASKLDYTILRSSMIYGGERDNNIEKLVTWLRRRRWIPLVAGGRNRVQPIYVDDLVEAIARALARPEATWRRALTVAGPEAMTQRALIETAGETLGRRPFFVPVPYAFVYAAATVMEWLPRPGGKGPLVTRAQVRRQLEDKTFDIREAYEALGGWRPRGFAQGMREKVRRL